MQRLAFLCDKPVSADCELHDSVEELRAPMHNEETIAPFFIYTKEDQEREERKNIYRHLTHSVEKSSNIPPVANLRF